MVETKVEAVKRSKWAEFLNTTPSTTNPTWSRIGKGVSENEISYNANVVTETFIDQDNADNSVDSYAPQIPVTQYAYKGDPVYDFIDSLRKARATGTACETQLLLVNKYDANTAGDTFSAELQPVAIQIDTFGGAGGERLSIGYNILFNGDPTTGTVTIADGVPTFKEGGTLETTSNTKSSKAVAD